ncbi:MAG: hypothetical protein VB934_14040 [Polyangiaceae bacterium]
MPASHYRYLLDVEIHPTDAAVLRDGIDGEEFGLRTRLGAKVLSRQIDEFQLKVDTMSVERWGDFEHDIEILSVYLSQAIEGREVHVEFTGTEPKIEGWKIIGRRGSTERLAIDVYWDAASDEIAFAEE